jgi:hypothetical protein
MTGRILIIGLVAVTSAAATRALVGAAPPPSNVPATAAFDDSIGMRILSDHLGVYAEGSLDTNCVRSWFNPMRGNYYFRTASNTFCDYWDGVPIGVIQRKVTLDFSSAVAGHGPPASCSQSDGHDHTLNLCAPNTIPDLRLIADDLFKSGGVFDTPVSIAFDLYPNFVNDTAFSLQFLQPVPVVAIGTARQLQATSAVAELSVRTTGQKPKLVPIAQYNMSFSMTVTPCPTSGCP